MKHALVSKSNNDHDTCYCSWYLSYEMSSICAISRRKKVPQYINYLGDVLPYAMIGLLVVYCLKSVSITTVPFGLPEFISILCIVGLHTWKKNTLLSIAGGTIIYMIVVQYVFV